MDLACRQDTTDPFRCRTKEEYLIQLLAMLPRGRAWQSHDAVASAVIQRFPEVPAECGEAMCGEAQVGQVGLIVERTTLAAYWAAYAEIEEFFAQRACALIDEFTCHTINETEDVWAEDYGFPDPCEPWNELCEKVAALGGANCDYLAWVASRRGWTISCEDCGTATPVATAGCVRAGLWVYPCWDCEANTLNIHIDVANSPAYTQRQFRPGYAGNARAGCTILCEPSPQQIECIIERFKPAHVEAVYIYNYTSTGQPLPLTVQSPHFGYTSLWTTDAISFSVGALDLGTPTLTEN